MFRMTRIVPSIVLTVAALALVAPAAQAKPLFAPSGAFAPSGLSAPSGEASANPSVRSTQDFNVYGTQRVHRDARRRGRQTPATLRSPTRCRCPTTPVTVPDSSGNGFDWTAAAIGAGLGGLLMLGLAAGFGSRRRGQLAA